MSEIALPSSRPGTTLNPMRYPARVRWLLRVLDRVRHGSISVRFPDGQQATFGAGSPRADITLANWNVLEAALSSGDIGVAETYFAGDWSSSDLVRLLAFFVRNRAAAEQLIYGNSLGRLWYRVRHLLHRNTRGQAKKNIQAHYDLGNDFYALWLDESMTYSSALFEEAGDPHAPATERELRAAQHAKYARVLDQLALPPGSNVLEIGCGWGGFAHTAALAGHRVTGLTLSPAQLSFAREQLSRDGLDADLRLQDYRDECGRYDGIASIEMFEAVGEAYWPAYFDALKRCLAPDGRACVQTIEIADALFERYRRGTDFIQQYVFPGGMLPSPGAFAAQAQRAGLRIVQARSFGRSYARTLATWRARFLAQQKAVRALGFDERFLRMWEMYLAYCEAAFAEGNTDVTQYTLVHAR
ncbi:MAG: class I SAM-dependent methyltransferase [Gemmatimonadota bacterium]